MKNFFILLALIILFLPLPLFAAGSPMGTNCDGNDDCTSGDCEDSSIVAGNDDFCVCGEPADCEQVYGKEQGEIWECTDEDDDEYYDLHYCQSNTRGKQSPFTVGQLAGQKAQAEKAEGEKQTPYPLQPPKINVQFDTLQPFTTTMVTPGEAVSIPWMAEYIIAVYRYAIIIGSILAVIVIMIGGVLYLTAGGIPSNVTKAGSLIFGAITGLVLLLSSYLILNTINPNLTKLGALTIQTITAAEDIVAEPFGDEPIIPPSASGQEIKVQPASCTDDKYKSATGDTTYFGLWECELKKKRTLDQIKGIIIHEGGKSVKSTVNIWKSVYAKKQLPVGAHYIIDRDGKLYQIIDETRVAIHANSANKAVIGIDLIIPSDCSQSGSAANFKTCANYTDAQYNTLKNTIENIATRTSVKFNDLQIAGHCQVKDATHADPRGFQWSKIGLNPSSHFSLPNYIEAGTCLKNFSP